VAKGLGACTVASHKQQRGVVVVAKKAQQAQDEEGGGVCHCTGAHDSKEVTAMAQK
jgi:hypothetical protein